MAHALDAAVPAGLPVFEIADAEMASGIFKDIEAAIDAPGSETRPGSASLLPFPSLPPGPVHPLLPQATYPFRHGEEVDEIFIVPVAQDANGTQYEAIFF